MSYEVLFPSEQSYCVCGVSKNQRLRQAREVIANVGMDRRSKLTDAFLRLLVGVTSGSGNLNPTWTSTWTVPWTELIAGNPGSLSGWLSLHDCMDLPQQLAEDDHVGCPSRDGLRLTFLLPVRKKRNESRDASKPQACAGYFHVKDVSLAIPHFSSRCDPTDRPAFIRLLAWNGMGAAHIKMRSTASV